MENKNKIFRLLLVVLVLAFMGVIFSHTKAEANDADLKAGAFGPDIAVGLHEYSRSYLKDNAFRLTANKQYNIKNRDGDILATIDADIETRVKYDGDKNFEVYQSLPETKIYKQITFDAADDNNDDLIFEISLPDCSYDSYRRQIRLRYAEIDDADDKIWAINILPMEHYVWGMGEITGTGDKEYNKVMTTIFRTYGYWKARYGTKYNSLGFKLDNTAGSQIYRGYQWEKDHPRIKDAALSTEGRLLMYKNDIALTAYHSWNDGKTRRYEDGCWSGSCPKKTGTISKIYPFLSAIKDKSGKNKSKTTKQLAQAGNHMVGLCANGALKLASKNDWGYKKILQHYYRKIKIYQAYK